MSDAAIQYISEGFLGDQIEIQIHLDDLSRVGFDMYYNMINTTQSKVLAQVKTGILFFDYQNRKVCAVPDEFKNRIF
jgi:acyl-CoA thioesterase FadM